jgi:multidrug efflux pump subunit AcrA (membrane-fusion protein)
VDPTTRTVKARAEVANPGGLLKAEMLVTVGLTTPARADVSVPASAVLLQRDGHFVYVEESRGTLRRQPVDVGPALGGTVPVVHGLRSGDRVVTQGALLVDQLYRTGGKS